VADNKTNAEAMAYAEKFVKHWQGNELIIPAIAPHPPYTVSEEHLKAIRAFSDRTGAPIVTHISERSERSTTASRPRPSPIDYLARIAFSAQSNRGARCLASEEELGILHKRLASAWSTTRSPNMKLAFRCAPVPEM